MRVKRLAAAAVAFSAFVAACGSDDDNDATAGVSESDGEETDSSTPGGADNSIPEFNDAAIDADATVRIVGAAPPPVSWDPANTRNTTQDIQYFAYVYDTLLRLNADNELEPSLATEWSFDETNTVLTLTLRDDVTFSDGEAFTADVAKLNLDRVREGTGAAARLLTGIESIEATDATTLVITQAAPTAKIVFALASTASSMASPLAIEDPDALALAPVGSGPYTVESSDTTTVEFVRNDGYWNTSIQFAAGHTMTGTSDGNARLNGLLSGTVDLAQISQTPPTPDALARVESGELQMFEVSGQPTLLGINNNVEPFDDPRVVEALNYAIDRDTFNEVIYNGACAPASQFFVEGQPGYIEGLEYEYDVDKARELMAEAGVDGVDVQFQTVAGAPTAGVELLQSMMAEIGINAEITQAPIAEIFPNFFGGQFGVSALQLTLPVPDSSYTTDYLTGPLNPGTHDETLVELVDAANTLAPDDPGRDAAYEAVGEYLFENPVGVPLCRLPNVMIADADVVGLGETPFASIGGNDYTRIGMASE